ncbi:hypothetical protein HRbin30_02250 [bacterium HR30]|nr:hypothetical protein HRbin30_02250 [bacterium HR30]
MTPLPVKTVPAGILHPPRVVGSTPEHSRTSTLGMAAMWRHGTSGCVGEDPGEVSRGLVDDLKVEKDSELDHLSRASTLQPRVV